MQYDRLSQQQPSFLFCVLGSSSWCPKIYFNYRCFTGPYLSKGRLMLLPQSVGPGPVSLVMREVLTMLINVAYKSSRVLRELQLDGLPNPDMQQQVLGAKYVILYSQMGSIAMLLLTLWIRYWSSSSTHLVLVVMLLLLQFLLGRPLMKKQSLVLA